MGRGHVVLRSRSSHRRSRLPVQLALNQGDDRGLDPGERPSKKRARLSARPPHKKEKPPKLFTASADGPSSTLSSALQVVPSSRAGCTESVDNSGSGTGSSSSRRTAVDHMNRREVLRAMASAQPPRSPQYKRTTQPPVVLGQVGLSCGYRRRNPGCTGKARPPGRGSRRRARSNLPVARPRRG